MECPNFESEIDYYSNSEFSALKIRFLESWNYNSNIKKCEFRILKFYIMNSEN